MLTCDQKGCTGHLGKFDSCRDEALYELSLDSFGSSTGDSSFRGHFTPISVSEPETVKIPDGLEVIVPAGHYMVIGHNSGAVSVDTYDSEEELSAAFKVEEDAYAEWDDES